MLFVMPRRNKLYLPLGLHQILRDHHANGRISNSSRNRTPHNPVKVVQARQLTSPYHSIRLTVLPVALRPALRLPYLLSKLPIPNSLARLLRYLHRHIVMPPPLSLRLRQHQRTSAHLLRMLLIPMFLREGSQNLVRELPPLIPRGIPHTLVRHVSRSTPMPPLPSHSSFIQELRQLQQQQQQLQQQMQQLLLQQQLLQHQPDQPGQALDARNQSRKQQAEQPLFNPFE